MRIAKFLALNGLSSRRNAEKMIIEGRVEVNNSVISSPALNITNSDLIKLDGNIIKHDHKITRLWLYYKPVGLITTHKDPQKRETIFSSLPSFLPRVISVGRLDINSEGLLLLTNSGDLVRKLENPASKISRKYKVRAFGSMPAINIKDESITIDGITYNPKLIKLILGKEQNSNKGNFWYEVILQEGKNREVRKIFEYFGYKVNRLIRTEFGRYKLENMKPGDIKEVNIS